VFARSIGESPDREGTYDLWLMERDGSGARALGVAGGGWVRRPAVSPDGGWVAFTRYAIPFDQDLEAVQGGYRVRPGLQTGIWIAPLVGESTARRSVVAPEAFNSFPAWAPDGSLVFSSTRSGSADIYRLSVPLVTPGTKR
jgi:Tol biopolymer transport system component